MTKSAKKNVAKFVTKKRKSPVATQSHKRGTKSATVLGLLESKSGSTIAEMATSTGWQNHSVRGFLSGTVRKKLGRKIVSEIVDEDRRYRIAG